MSDKQIISLKPALIRILFAVLILCVTGAILLWTRKDDLTEHYSIQVVEPTCTANGYSLYTHLETGEVTIRDIVAAKGHTFDPWVLIAVGDEVNCGFSKRICEACGHEETRAE